jgi:hypothetical protein
MMLKEQLIGFLNALTDILYRLRTNLLPELEKLKRIAQQKEKTMT